MKHRHIQATEPVAERSSQTESRVFPVGPRADRYFASETAERVRLLLVRCVERMEGPALLIGPSGTGKSLMLSVLAESFRFRLSVAMLPGGLLRTPRELHQGILYALGLPFRGLDEGELRLSLLQRLEADEDSQEGVLLLVDEAQLLSAELMEELRMLTNIVRDGTSQVRLVLAGTPVLEELLADPHLECFHQRIAVRCYLQKMTRSETRSYIQAHLNAARREVGLFTPEALDAIHDASEGLPRLINQVCDQSLLLAEAAGRDRVDAAIVHQAWSDLQQLPAVSSRADGLPSDSGEQEDVIEFGAWQDPLGSGEADLDGRPTFYDEDHEDLPAGFGRGFGIIHGEPDDRIDAIAEQIASIHDDDSPPEQNEQFTPDVSDIDFSLPDNEWPEVEVVVRGTRRAAAGDFREEEVIADPFPLTAGHRSGWFVQTEVTCGGRGRAPARLTPHAQTAPIETEPLSSVPLMVQVQTDLYTPDPVLPETADGEAAVVLPANPGCEVGVRRQNGPSAPMDQPHRPEQQGPHTADLPSAGPAPRAARAGTKRFATLFSSLQD